MAVEIVSAGPFRPKPPALEVIRSLLRFLRVLKIRMAGSFRFDYGRSISFGSGAYVSPPHFIVLGDFVSIGKGFTCEADLVVGSHVLISSQVSVIGQDHPFDVPGVTVYDAPRVDTSVVEIGSDVLIGFGTIIVGSVRIGDRCIVGAGSIVTRDLPPGTICVGSPARPIKSRFPQS